MELKPVETRTAPGYPTCHASRLGLGGRLRRLLAASVAVAALFGAGCGSFRETDDEIDDIDLAGAQEMPVYFTCADERPAWVPTLLPDGRYDGVTCGELAAWARLVVAEPVTVTGSLASGDRGVAADLITPEGLAAIGLRDTLPPATFHLTAGDWTVVVTSERPEVETWFALELFPFRP